MATSSLYAALHSFMLRVSTMVQESRRGRRPSIAQRLRVCDEPLSGDRHLPFGHYLHSLFDGRFRPAFERSCVRGLDAPRARAWPFYARLASALGADDAERAPHVSHL